MEFNDFLTKKLTILDSFKELEGKTILFYIDDRYILTVDDCIFKIDTFDDVIYSEDIFSFDTNGNITYYTLGKILKKLGYVDEEKINNYVSEDVSNRNLRIKEKYNL